MWKLYKTLYLCGGGVNHISASHTESQLLSQEQVELSPEWGWTGAPYFNFNLNVSTASLLHRACQEVYLSFSSKWLSCAHFTCHRSTKIGRHMEIPRTYKKPFDVILSCLVLCASTATWPELRGPVIAARSSRFIWFFFKYSFDNLSVFIRVILMVNFVFVFL